MKRSLRTTGLIAIAASLALVASACTSSGGSSTPDSSGGGGTTLIASHPQEPTNWNYLEDSTSALMVPIYLNVVESLFESSEDGTLNPMLAESYEVSDDAMTYTITLREATFHDGSDFDSADVVYSLKKNVGGANGTVSGPLRVLDDVQAPDARTVIVTLTTPSNSFVAGIGSTAGMIVPEGFFETADAGKKLIGTGPFVFAEHRPDIDVTLERYEDYWGTKPQMQKIIHRFMSDETATINALRAGELDVIGMLLGDGIDQVAPLENDANFSVTFTPSSQNSYLFLNPSVEAFQDERVRQAIAHSVERAPIITAAVGGYAEETCLYVFPWGVPWNTDYCPFPYDPEKSKQLLADAGYADGLVVDFPYLTIAEFPTSFEILNAQLTAVGITVNGRGQDLGTYFEQSWDNRDYEIAHMTSNSSIFSLSCEGDIPPFANLDQSLCDPEFEAFISNNDQIVDPDEYVAQMEKMLNRLTDTAWIVPMFGKNEPGVAKAGVGGIAPFRTAYEMDYRGITMTQ